jgi:hypothetical protein
LNGFAISIADPPLVRDYACDLQDSVVFPYLSGPGLPRLIAISQILPHTPTEDFQTFASFSSYALCVPNLAIRVLQLGRKTDPRAREAGAGPRACPYITEKLALVTLG